MSQKSEEMESSCTLNLRVTIKGKKQRLCDISSSFLELIRSYEDLHISILGIDFNNPKDQK